MTDLRFAIFVHGRNQTPDFMREVGRRLDLPQLPFVAPAANENSWYPLGFMAPFADNQPRLDDALAYIERCVVEAESRGLNRSQIALIGFSQGACLLCEYVYRRGESFGALIAFTGGLLGPAGTVWSSPAKLVDMPIYLGTNRRDTWVPVERVRETSAVFTSMSGAVFLDIHDDPDHGINDQMIARARDILAERLASHPSRI